MKSLTDPATLRELLEKHGFRFSKSLGQNFLIDASVPERIAESVQADSSCGVLEIGPGVGCLTAELSRRAGKVLSIELDRRLEPLLAETLADCGNVEILFSDVLRLDLQTVAEERLPFDTRLVCANLPYNITSPVLTQLIRADCFERICVMIQREVAERICAGPGGKDYGAFGLFVQWYCEPELLFSVPPHCFLPQPKVTSSVIRLTRRKAPPAAVEDEELMFRLIRAAFSQRRKTLVNAIASALPELGKPEVAELLQSCSFDPDVRGERLSLPDFARLSNAFTARQRNG